MDDIKYSISFDLGNVPGIANVINGQLMPLLSKAVNGVGSATAAKWKEHVYKAKLWSGEKDAYADSITWNFAPGSLSGFVEATYKHAEEIETGRPARDLKKMLNTSLKVRRTESGKRFLVIPIRHNVPGNNAHAKAMPANVHAIASPLGIAPASRHVMGTARMGSDPATSVVSSEQRLWAIDNVAICDSSVFVTSSGYNPTLTLAALARRAALLLAGGAP